MKTILAAIILCLSFSATAGGINSMSPPEPWDKLAHFVVSAGSAAGGYHLLDKYTDLKPWQSRLIAGTATFLIMAPGKELYDKNFDWKDFGASSAGVVVGVGFTFTF